MRNITLITLSLFISLCSYAQSDTLNLTFEQALNKMHNDNLALKSAEAEMKSQEYKRKTTSGSGLLQGVK